MSIVEHVAGVDDFEVAEATYRAAVARWPRARITLRTVASAHRRTVARRAGEVRQLELDLPALSAVECLRCLGERGHRSRRDDGRERALQHRQHLSSCPRLSGGRKRGIHQRALGRSRGGFTSKVHCLGDARGRPIAFHVTPGEAADCKSYDTLINLPERIGLRCRIILLGRPSSKCLPKGAAKKPVGPPWLQTIRSRRAPTVPTLC